MSIMGTTNHPDEQERAWPLGPMLKRERERLGLSHTEAAKRAGFSTTVWGQLESGRRSVGADHSLPARPRPKTVAAAANVVGIDAGEALRMAGHNPESLNPSSGGSPTIHDRELVDKLAYLYDYQKESIVAVINSMLKTNAELRGTQTPWQDALETPDSNNAVSPGQTQDIQHIRPL